MVPIPFVVPAAPFVATLVPATTMFAVLLLGLLGITALFSWPAIDTARQRQRPGSPANSTFHTSAVTLLAALGAMAASSTAGVLPNDSLTSTLSAVLMLAAGILLFGSTLSLPASGLVGAHRNRVLVDGMMITAGAGTFIWYFLLGPAVSTHWTSLYPALVGLGYPGTDILMVCALLVISAKSRRVQPLVWAPMVVSIILFTVASFLRESDVQAATSSSMSLVIILRTLGGCAVAASTLILSRGKVSAMGAEAGESSNDESDSGTDGERHIWDSLLPYALVPAAAALAAYSWERNLESGITGGVLFGTAALVMLTFLRQLLASRENQRLYARAAEAFEEVQAHAENIERLNERLHQAQAKLQANNGELAKANQLLHQQATRDPLTGLPNHRAMVQNLDQELERSGRYSRSCSVLFIDLDHFKSLNDSCGHLYGDSVLRDLVIPMQSGLRANDVAGRWGGEEFVVVLPETELTEAMAAAERIRSLVAEHQFSNVSGGHVTCSIGVSTCPYDGTTRDELIEAADKAMYAAKRMGKNQVRSAADPSVVAFLSEARRGNSREEVTTWGVVDALTTLVRAHDPARDSEAAEISELAMRVAAVMRMPAPEIRLVGLAARLHDIGMLPTSSGDDHDHPAIGADIVSRVPSLSVIGAMIRSHHERWDGLGHPDGLGGTKIPLGSRIIAVCAAYVKLLHQPGVDDTRALDGVMVEAETCFDPTVVVALAQAVDQRSLAKAS